MNPRHLPGRLRSIFPAATPIASGRGGLIAKRRGAGVRGAAAGIAASLPPGAPAMNADGPEGHHRFPRSTESGERRLGSCCRLRVRHDLVRDCRRSFSLPAGSPTAGRVIACFLITVLRHARQQLRSAVGDGDARGSQCPVTARCIEFAIIGRIATPIDRFGQHQPHHNAGRNATAILRQQRGRRTN
jgi:hypothetical protein